MARDLTLLLCGQSSPKLPVTTEVLTELPAPHKGTVRLEDKALGKGTHTHTKPVKNLWELKVDFINIFPSCQ